MHERGWNKYHKDHQCPEITFGEITFVRGQPQKIGETPTCNRQSK